MENKTQLSHMRLSTVILFLLISVALNAQQWHTTIELKTPPAKTMPKGTNNLLLVNNTSTQPDDWEHTETRVFYMMTTSNSVNADVSASPVFCLFGMEKVLSESGEFESVSILDRSLNKSGQPFSRGELSKTQTDSLCRLYNADAVMALNQLLVSDIREIILTQDQSYYAYLQVIEISSWTIRHKNGTTSIYQQSDTLLWEAEKDSEEQALAALPDRKQAIEDMAMYVGEQTGQLFIPQWEKADRYYYENSDKNIREGMRLFEHMHFQEALAKWYAASLTEGKSRKAKQTRAYAFANMAALYESEGDFRTALKCAQEAQKSFSELNTAEGRQQQVNFYHYCKEIQGRL